MVAVLLAAFCTYGVLGVLIYYYSIVPPRQILPDCNNGYIVFQSRLRSLIRVAAYSSAVKVHARASNCYADVIDSIFEAKIEGS